MKKQKRILDIVIAGILLLITLPIMIIIAIAIKLDSAGPIFYYYHGQIKKMPVYRLGKDGKPFRYFKFRTMIHDPANPSHKEVTCVGHFLRCWHLDELPEFIIVLSGNMSLVGPRPLSKEAAGLFPTEYYRNLPVCPGITGQAQITGGRLDPPEKMIAATSQYTENWCLKKDFTLLIQTPIAIVAQCKMFEH
jgi:lipopolysaccharide/colanic/teichoic acid biosynthesis glycosyltransferase